MILEHLYQGEPGAWKIVFRASAEELARALAALEAEAGPAPDGGEEDRLAEAVNRAILAPDGFSTVWAEAVEKAGLQPPRPIRRLAIELEINQHHGAEERAADAAGKAQLRQQVIAGLYARRCEQARQLAQARLILCLGDQVTGPLPRQLMAEHYFAEQRRFHLSLQAQRVNFDQFLQVRGQTVEQFRAELHANAERKLRSRLGLLLVADKEGLWPSQAEVDAALAAWDDKRDGERTFPANDARKARQKLASQRAEAFVLEHSTLLPPPAQPTIVETA